MSRKKKEENGVEVEVTALRLIWRLSIMKRKKETRTMQRKWQNWRGKKVSGNVYVPEKRKNRVNSFI